MLLHPTALPEPGLGAGAERWLHWLAEHRVRVWQLLPVHPTDHSPYSARSVFAGNPAWLDDAWLVHEGFLPPEAAGAPRKARDAALVQRTERRLREDPALAEDWEAFGARERHWLEDYALYAALFQREQRPWWEWPQPLRDREPGALAEALKALADEVQAERLKQWLWDWRWRKLKTLAHALGVRLFGDAALYVAHDSADVWAHPRIFALDARGRCAEVAGVPPDAFSPTGQRWGNPLYRWELGAPVLAWWRMRARRLAALFDAVRIDHFRGIAAYWAIPAERDDATVGAWREGPGDALLAALHEEAPEVTWIAEDLGIITEEVEMLRRRWRMPGMKVLQFAFDSDAHNPYLPHHHEPEGVVYTGTHDNDTTLGWWRALDERRRDYVRRYLALSPEDEAEMPWPLVRAALASPARWAVIPAQDVLGLGSEARFNRPGTVDARNWRWQADARLFDPKPWARLADAIALYGRA